MDRIDEERGSNGFEFFCFQYVTRQARGSLEPPRKIHRIIKTSVRDDHLTYGRKAAKRPSGQAAKRPSGQAAKRPSGQAAKRPSGQAAKLPSEVVPTTSAKARTPIGVAP
ncbi:hypothetical protein FEI13_16880 [Halomonas urmiana]|uniref:Uncharacterized protein n=1 Tax=Halomonas urmiana TaxID=490901 RepID=A0A5R8M960_9GAMM|nr:hypothetical protein FEI13_16880 [Halomonas urmiana]